MSGSGSLLDVLSFDLSCAMSLPVSESRLLEFADEDGESGMLLNGGYNQYDDCKVQTACTTHSNANKMNAKIGCKQLDDLQGLNCVQPLVANQMNKCQNRRAQCQNRLMQTT